MDQKIKFLFAVHNHQPVGNFEHVFQDVFERSYRPYFSVLSDFPELKTSVHFSGPLLEWFKAKQPGFLKMISDMAASGCLEIISGGFYEPILSSIPEEDAIGQIEMMNRFIRDELGFDPQGLWLAERIWTPELPRILHAAGIRYTVLDDTHFHYAGLEESQIKGYFITEKHGHPLYVFPINRGLRYNIPFKLPGEVLDSLKRAYELWGHDVVTYADDGEKFGAWPDTYHWVYEEKWLENFFRTLKENSHWIETVTFGECLESQPAEGRIYLPMASYDEMMEWSLPVTAARKFHALKDSLRDKGVEEQNYRMFLRGATWDNFFTKYQESNHLHKKMLWVSRMIHKLAPEEREKSGALKELYRGQCNCAMWHGLFGGLYLNYLRHALYKHLIAAENMVDSCTGEARFAEMVDFNMDGFDEAIVKNPCQTAIVSPAYGGGLVELDFRPLCFNVTNVLGRREESYHEVLVNAPYNHLPDEASPKSIHDRVQSKEPDLGNRLVFDRWERFSFLDHFLGEGTRLENFKTGNYKELGDFVGSPYKVLSSALDPENPVLKLRRSGFVVQGENKKELVVEKEYAFSPDVAESRVNYCITHGEPTPLNLLWGVEFNFTLLAPEAVDRYYLSPGLDLENRKMNSEGEFEGKILTLRDEWQRFELSFETFSQATFWRFPVETVSQSESGFERTYQGSCLLVYRRIVIPPGEAFRASFELKMRSY